MIVLVHYSWVRRARGLPLSVASKWQCAAPRSLPPLGKAQPFAPSPIPRPPSPNATAQRNDQRRERPPVLGAQAGSRVEQPRQRFDHRLQGATRVRETARRNCSDRRNGLRSRDRNPASDRKPDRRRHRRSRLLRRIDAERRPIHARRQLPARRQAPVGRRRRTSAARRQRSAQVARRADRNRSERHRQAERSDRRHAAHRASAERRQPVARRRVTLDPAGHENGNAAQGSQRQAGLPGRKQREFDERADRHGHRPARVRIGSEICDRDGSHERDSDNAVGKAACSRPATSNQSTSNQ